MNVSFYVYDTATGRILSVGRCPQSMVADQASQPGTASGEGDVDPRRDTINTTTGLPNPPPGTPVPATLDDLAMAADGADEALVSGLTNGTTVHWFDSAVTVIDDGELRVTSEYAGSFDCELRLDGYAPRALTFVAT